MDNELSLPRFQHLIECIDTKIMNFDETCGVAAKERVVWNLDQRNDDIHTPDGDASVEDDCPEEPPDVLKSGNRLSKRLKFSEIATILL